MVPPVQWRRPCPRRAAAQRYHNGQATPATVDQREHVAYLTAAGEAAIEAALPYWRKAQDRIAALVQPSAIGELADQLDAGGRVSRFPREKRAGRSKNANSHP
jgi:hypothetical protein